MPAFPWRLALVFVVGLGPLAHGASAQEAPSALVEPRAQDLKLVAYNVLLGAGIGGLGAVLNGTEDEWHARFARGAAGGAFGGAALFASKRMTQLVASQEVLAYALPAVAVHQLGASVIENAALDEPLFGRLSAHTGFVRWEWTPASGNVRARILPGNAIVFVVLATQYRLDPLATLATATPIFTSPDAVNIFGGNGRLVRGFASLDNVYLQDGIGADVVAHELVHAFQAREYARTTVLHRPLGRPLEASGLWRALGEVFYFDSPHALALAYLVVEGGAQSDRCYFDNWYEREAQTLSTGQNIRVCTR